MKIAGCLLSSSLPVSQVEQRMLATAQGTASVDSVGEYLWRPEHILSLALTGHQEDSSFSLPDLKGPIADWDM